MKTILTIFFIFSFTHATSADDIPVEFQNCFQPKIFSERTNRVAWNVALFAKGISDNGVRKFGWEVRNNCHEEIEIEYCIGILDIELKWTGKDWNPLKVWNIWKLGLFFKAEYTNWLYSEKETMKLGARRKGFLVVDDDDIRNALSTKSLNHEDGVDDSGLVHDHVMGFDNQFQSVALHYRVKFKNKIYGAAESTLPMLSNEPKGSPFDLTHCDGSFEHVMPFGPYPHSRIRLLSVGEHEVPPLPLID